jgi:DNA-binding transcriptional LysR family regulator
MRLRGFDLNLLIALDVLLAERSVSAAGRRMYMSQSAMSSILKRLREHFEDDLLVQVGRVMVPTAFAEGLVEPIRELLIQVESTAGPGGAFDPATSHRHFTIQASDFLIEVVLSRVIREAARIAPGITITLILAQQGAPASNLERGVTDMILIPNEHRAYNHPAETLLEEDHVLVGWAENAAMRHPVTLDGFLALGHVAVNFAEAREISYAERHMEQFRGSRRVEVIAPSFTIVPGLLVGTQRVAVMHRRLAERYAGMYPLRHAELPFDIPHLRELVQTHRARGRDIGLGWLRNLVRRCADQLGPETAET